jgi:hypothetical protein
LLCGDGGGGDGVAGDVSRFSFRWFAFFFRSFDALFFLLVSFFGRLFFFFLLLPLNSLSVAAFAGKKGEKRTEKFISNKVTLLQK